MPALQVRDFPDDLYEELKAYAERHRRSVAQQTVVAVETMLHAGQGVPEDDGLHIASKPEPEGTRYLDISTEAEKALRREKRKYIFKQIEATRMDIPAGFPHPADVVREGREERSEDFDRLIPRL